MGLDISVYRLKQIDETCRKNEDYFTLNEDNNFPDWTKPFITKELQEYYDWDKFKEESGIDVDALKWCGTKYDGENSEMYLRDEEDKEITIKLEKIPLRKQIDDVIGFEEVGYQRKGLNSKFYRDYEEGKIGYFVWTKSELERYKEEYCDEVDQDGLNFKENFQKNIIDKFIEGKDCVTFDW